MFCGSSVKRTCQGWSIFPWSVAKITFPDAHFTEHKLSSVAIRVISGANYFWKMGGHPKIGSAQIGP